MTEEIPISVVVEDLLSGTVVKKMLASARQAYAIQEVRTDGFGKIKKNIRAYNNAAKGWLWFVLADLDEDKGGCAPELVSDLLSGVLPHPNLIFRVAVREVESWVMADREAFSSLTCIPVEALPKETDTIDDPKAFIFPLIKKYSAKSFADAVLPGEDTTRKIGFEYNERFTLFVKKTWDARRAETHSDSLCRAMRALDTFRCNTH